jgi:hypothetical protein
MGRLHPFLSSASAPLTVLIAASLAAVPAHAETKGDQIDRIMQAYTATERFQGTVLVCSRNSECLN